MPAKYKKLEPYALRALAQEVTAAARAVVEMSAQLREGACRRPKGVKGSAPPCESHQLRFDARELNLAARAVVDLSDMIREELYLAAKEVQKARLQKRKAAPKCGAWTARGGRCTTPLEPAQFRCPLHAEDLRKRRKGSSERGGQPRRRGTPWHPLVSA